MKKRTTVFVGISGGVDSSIAAHLLIQEGYEVVGVFIKTWQPDFIPCTWKEERHDAMRVCAALGIPFLTCDAEATYRDDVAQYMIESYRRGETPNPDVMCNRYVKFGAFWEFAQALGADCIATGHYARIENGTLFRGVDRRKDQSYFLWKLTGDELAHIRFPLGTYHKETVRLLAKKLQLPTATKRDSQGICFLGDVDMKAFLAHYIPSQEGVVLDENGTAIGTHPGAHLFTIGERHGFTITRKGTNDAPRYVIAKDIATNTIIVSSHPREENPYQQTSVQLEQVHWITTPPQLNRLYEAQVRYQGARLPVSLRNEHEVTFAEPQIDLARGQSLVIYDHDECLGGGNIVY